MHAFDQQVLGQHEVGQPRGIVGQTQRAGMQGQGAQARENVGFGHATLWVGRYLAAGFR